MSTTVSSSTQHDLLTIGRHQLGSRLILGSGKYDSFEIMGRSITAAETACVTIAVRREKLHDSAGRNILGLLGYATLNFAAQYLGMLRRRYSAALCSNGARDFKGT